MARRKTVKQEPKSYSSPIYRQIVAAFLFIVSIFILLSLLFDLTGPAGQFINHALKGLFGYAAFVIPLMFIYLAIGTSAGGTKTEVNIRIWSGAVSIISLSIILHIFYHQNELFVSKDLPQIIVMLYDSGVNLKSGGVIGGALGVPLVSLFAKVGTGIIVGFILLVSFMLATGVTLYQMLKTMFPFKFKDLATAFSDLFNKEKKPKEKPQPTIQNYERKEAEERARIDIPIDEPVKKIEPQVDDILDVLNPEPASVAEPVKTMPKKAEKETKPIFPELDPKESEIRTYYYPPLTLLAKETGAAQQNIESELKANAQKLITTLQSFGVEAKVINISRGPAVTRYELQPNAGVKISRITNLADDLALNLAAQAVRIEAPIPGKAAIGIEVPNSKVSTILARSIIASPEFKESKSKLTVALGKDLAGNTIVTDISRMPHLLIAGSTGSGKSVCINTMLMSLLYKASPDEVKLILVDPKVVELGVYNGIPHLLIPVITSPKKAAGALNWAVQEMLKRYQLFAEKNVRDMASYNSTLMEEGMKTLPHIVIVIDELADLMMSSPTEVEDAICRLAQMARAAGMHIVIATQRPSVDVITGTIKANIVSRIAFAVSSQVDSRIILDASGAEKLLGKGDMLFMPIGQSKPTRIQGCFVTDREVEGVIEFIKSNNCTDYDNGIVDQIDQASKPEQEKEEGGDGDADALLPEAIECVVEAGIASVSLLQRKLKLGYARAARIVDEMEARGVVGPYEGSKPRKVLISRAQWQEMIMSKKD